LLLSGRRDLKFDVKGQNATVSRLSAPITTSRVHFTKRDLERSSRLPETRYRWLPCVAARPRMELTAMGMWGAHTDTINSLFSLDADLPKSPVTCSYVSGGCTIVYLPAGAVVPWRTGPSLRCLMLFSSGVCKQHHPQDAPRPPPQGRRWSA
jgi:hypothetical protein